MWLHKSFVVKYCSFANIGKNFSLLLGVFSSKTKGSHVYLERGLGTVHLFCFWLFMEVNKTPTDAYVGFSEECVGQRMWLF